MAERKRAAVNTVIPGKIFQRGQIFTWTHDVKAKFIAELDLKTVVNFWPKTDAELGFLGLHWYWQISSPRSEQMLEPYILQAAESVADYLLRKKENNTLILCEAGKTRSVFFTILVVSMYKDISYLDAREYVAEKVPGMSLKGFMEDWLKKHNK